MDKDKVIVFADHQVGYQITEFLIANQKDYEIVNVYTNKQINAWWKKLDSNSTINSKLKYYENETDYDLILNQDIDYLLLLSWKHIIPEIIISHVNKCVINLHYSLLPNHRGVYPINHAIESGDVETGITFHIVEPGIDTGPILVQKKVKIEWTDDVYSMLTKLDEISVSTFKEIWQNRDYWQRISRLQEGVSTYHARKQYVNNCKLELGKLYTARELINLIRSRTFGASTSAYFIDDSTGEKYYVSIKVNKSEI